MSIDARTSNCHLLSTIIIQNWQTYVSENWSFSGLLTMEYIFCFLKDLVKKSHIKCIIIYLKLHRVQIKDCDIKSYLFLFDLYCHKLYNILLTVNYTIFKKKLCVWIIFIRYPCQKINYLKRVYYWHEVVLKICGYEICTFRNVPKCNLM